MMSTDLAETPQVQPSAQAPLDAAAALQVSLTALRNQGAQHLDPARFHYLEVVLQRLSTQPRSVRLRLESRLQQAVAQYTDRFTEAQEAAGNLVASLSVQHPPRARALRRLLALGDFRAVHHIAESASAAANNSPAPPLALLNQHIRAVRQDGTSTSTVEGGMGSRGEALTRSELPSLRQFRESWSRHNAVDQVQQAVSRGPENAGPLNSHMLVLHSLERMRALSPHYLQHFMAHAETLLWLEQANARLPKAKAKATKAAPKVQKKVPAASKVPRKV